MATKYFLRIIEEQDKRRLTQNVESSEADEIKKNNLEEKQVKEKQTINS